MREWTRSREPPGLLDVLTSATTVTLNRYNYETVDLFRQNLDRLVAEIREARCSRAARTASPDCGDVAAHLVEISFAQHPDPDERMYLNELPTMFGLSHEQVDRTIAAARTLLAASPEFQALLATSRSYPSDAPRSPRGEKRVQRRDHLRAFADGGGDALHRPARTSPIAKTPCAAGLERPASAPSSAPVRTKPFASSATSDGDSQSVFGSAPMNRNRWRIGRRVSSPRGGGASGSPRARRPALRARVTSVCDAAPRRSAGRRCGRPDSATCVASRLGPRTSSQTFATWPARYTDRLAGGVAGADQRDLLAGAELPLERRGPVVDRRALELGEVRDVEAAVADAARDHHRTRAARARRSRGRAGSARRSPSARHRRRTTSSGIAISAPNFCAWLKARAISAMPRMPVGKPR